MDATSEPYTNAKIMWKLEACIDDERQFKMANCPQMPGDATVPKRFFRDNFVIFHHR